MLACFCLSYHAQQAFANGKGSLMPPSPFAIFFSSLRSFRSPSSTARLCLENGKVSMSRTSSNSCPAWLASQLSKSTIFLMVPSFIVKLPPVSVETGGSQRCTEPLAPCQGGSTKPCPGGLRFLARGRIFPGEKACQRPRFAISREKTTGCSGALRRVSISCILNVRALSTCVQTGDCSSRLS